MQVTNTTQNQNTLITKNMSSQITLSQQEIMLVKEFLDKVGSLDRAIAMNSEEIALLKATPVKSKKKVMTDEEKAEKLRIKQEKADAKEAKKLAAAQAKAAKAKAKKDRKFFLDVVKQVEKNSIAAEKLGNKLAKKTIALLKWAQANDFELEDIVNILESEIEAARSDNNMVTIIDIA